MESHYIVVVFERTEALGVVVVVVVVEGFSEEVLCGLKGSVSANIPFCFSRVSEVLYDFWNIGVKDVSIVPGNVSDAVPRHWLDILLHISRIPAHGWARDRTLLRGTRE